MGFWKRGAECNKGLVVHSGGGNCWRKESIRDWILGGCTVLEGSLCSVCGGVLKARRCSGAGGVVAEQLTSEEGKKRKHRGKGLLLLWYRVEKEICGG